MVPSPPPRLPVAQGAFFRSYPRRAAKGASLKRVLLSREWKGGSAPPQGVQWLVPFQSPCESGVAGCCQGRRRVSGPLWLGRKPRFWGLQVSKDWRAGREMQIDF